MKAQYDALTALLEPEDANAGWDWKGLFAYMKKVRARDPHFLPIADARTVGALCSTERDAARGWRGRGRRVPRLRRPRLRRVPRGHVPRAFAALCASRPPSPPALLTPRPVRGNGAQPDRHEAAARRARRRRGRRRVCARRACVLCSVLSTAHEHTRAPRA
jgi:hypothetical protein